MGSLGLHVSLLNDVVRTSAFDRALAETVRPGDVVADLGAGSGILGLLALRHGARRVYAVERHPVAEVARIIARENGADGRLVFLRGEAGEVRLPEKADVVVSETLGNAVFDEGLLELMLHARRRLLKPRGRLIPSKVRVIAAPAATPEMPGRWPYGLRLDPLRALALHTSWSPVKVSLRGTPRRLGVALPGKDRLPLEFGGRFRTPGAQGVLLWFDADLSPSVRLDSRRSPSWKPAFFPARERLKGTFGLRIRFDSEQEPIWQFDDAPAQTTALGEIGLIARRSLTEDAVPRITTERRRHARILAAVDGRKTLRDLARGVKGLGYAEALRLVQSVCIDDSLVW
jgi:SAM-dependent methyltransferase